MATIPDVTVRIEMDPSVERLLRERPAPTADELADLETTDRQFEKDAKLHRVDVTLTPTGRRSRIFLDGKELRAVRSCSIKAEVGAVTTVTLELYAGEGSGLHVETEAFQAVELLPLHKLDVAVVDKLLRLIEQRGEEGAALALDKAIELSQQREKLVRATPELAEAVKK